MLNPDAEIAHKRSNLLQTAAILIGMTVLVVALITRAHHRSLLQWNLELDDKVHERTRELRVARDRAEEATP